NLLLDKMVREKVSSNQVVIANNQVFIAERILRSINSVVVGTENSENSAHDFSVDIETFGVSLDAQLNGNAELVVAQVESPEVRVSVEG
ncbi:chemotaxis protein, partial [Acinetobacter nosocomialis]